MRNPAPAPIRFWRKVRLSPDCWEWTGSLRSSGYGAFRPGDNRGSVGAHRWAFEFATGRPIPDGMHVCHSCDNRICVRPTHLWLGTNADNMRDRNEKGRQASLRGERNGNARLTVADVADIRRRHVLPGVGKGGGRGNTSILAREFGVDRTCIQKIISGKLWPDVAA